MGPGDAVDSCRYTALLEPARLKSIELTDIGSSSRFPSPKSSEDNELRLKMLKKK